MSRSFLASLRGTDARSVARALALLLLFNGIFGAYHASAMANGHADAILCTSDGAVRVDQGLPQVPAGLEEISCCVLGSGPSPAAIAAEPALLSGTSFGQNAPATPLADSILREPRHAGSASPRGPPALA